MREVIGSDTQVELANRLLDDLVQYTKKPRDLVIARCKSAMAELAWAWHDKKETLDFYKTTDLYIFDLTHYQARIVMDVDMMIEEIKARKLKKILDFGGGIGEYTIRAIKEAGADVTYLELADSETLKYAQYRFTKHGVKPTIVDETYPWKAEKWDAVIAMDVIEHLEQKEADETIKALNENAQYVFANPEFIKFNDLLPQHITQFKLDDFEKVGTMIYKKK